MRGWEYFLVTGKTIVNLSLNLPMNKPEIFCFLPLFNECWDLAGQLKRGEIREKEILCFQDFSLPYSRWLWLFVFTLCYFICVEWGNTVNIVTTFWPWVPVIGGGICRGWSLRWRTCNMMKVRLSYTLFFAISAWFCFSHSCLSLHRFCSKYVMPRDCISVLSKCISRKALFLQTFPWFFTVSEMPQDWKLWVKASRD